MSKREVFFEFTRLGPLMKVAAIDAETGTEVVIQGPAKHATALLQKTALAKLQYVLKKKEAAGER